MTNTAKDISPVKASERFAILDVLRGFALLGICMANFPEFSLYNFLPQEAKSSMSTAVQDNATHWLLYLFVDGKFYTLFSLLFGIGFSIILRNAERKGANGLRIFYRRMALLLVIGFAHLMFIWSGNILMLYALLGMLLPLFRRMSDKGVLRWAVFFLFLPVLVDFICEMTHTRLALPFVRLQDMYCAKYGINAENFAYWLRDAEDYGTVFQFLVQGAFVRMQEFVDGNRYFKVLGPIPDRLLRWTEPDICRFGGETGTVVESVPSRLGGRFALLFPLRLERDEPAPSRPRHAQCVLSRQCLPSRLHIRCRTGAFILEDKRRSGMEMARLDRPDGIDQLHRAVRHRNVPVLWHRHGLRDHPWTLADRNHRGGRIPFSNGIQCGMDALL